MLKLLAVVLVLQGVALAAPSSAVVTHELETALHRNNVANIFITLKEDTSTVLATITSTRFADRSSRLNALHSALLSNCERSQQPIQNFLASLPQTFQVKSFWITNQIYIKNADASLVSQLAENFSNIIANIDEEFFAHLIQPVAVNLNVTINANENQWGVEKIQAPQAWEHVGGLDKAGEGVVIGTCDTGVRVSHEALKDNFVGDYGWLDPSTGTATPFDSQGHGTHTTGTICGGKGVGVAPKAKWAACRGCAGIFCAQSDLLACGEFFVCPSLADGSKRDCSRAPHLVSNSWGGGRGNTWYNGVISSYHTAGIIPFFSIGNNGPSCNTANSPGDQNVIASGSTTVDDEISYFSSVGPTTDGRIKPDISAPGSEVISAYATSDTAYASLSGTSMAAPHTSGTVALLLTRNKDLTFEQAKSLISGNTDKDLKFSGRVCDGVGDSQFPNHVFGSGRLNALKSVRAQTAL